MYTLRKGVTKNVRIKFASISSTAVLLLTSLSGAAPLFLTQKAFAASPANEYVATTGTDSADCSDSGAPCKTITNALAQADNGTVIHVGAGTYTENVNVNKAVTLEGAGAADTNIVATDANSTPLTFNTNGATVSGFTITHDYTPAELSAWNFNNNGVAFGQLTSGNTLEDSTVSLSRNGVYINRSQNNLVDNTITDNRTGINATNTIDGSNITGNTISNNWTLGFVYYDGGYSTNFDTVTMTGNTFDNNWYTQVEVKSAAGSTGTLDVTDNTFSDSPVTYTTSSDAAWNEPGFTDQQPVELGGTATKPATAYPTLRIYSSGSVVLKHTPKTLRVGTSEPYKTIQSAIADASAGDTIEVDAGTYSGDVNIPVNDLTIASTGSVVLNLGSGYGINLDSPPLATTGFTMSGITVNASSSTTYAFKAYKADDLTLTNDTFNGGAGNTGGGVDINTTSNVTLNNVTANGFHKNGFAYTSQYLITDTPASGIAFDNVTASNDGWAGIAFYTMNGSNTAGHDISGVTFSGNTTLTGDGQGLFVEGDSDANHINHATPSYDISGSGGAPVDLGTTAFSGNTQDIDNYQTNDLEALSATFNGQTGADMSYSQRAALKSSSDIIDSATYPTFGTVNIFDASGYVNDPSQSKFMVNPEYVRSNNSSDTAGQVLVPKDAQSVRFTYTQTDGSNVYSDVVGTQHIQAGQYPVPSTGQQQWRGGVSAAVGTYNVTAEYQVGSNWFPVTGQATAYVLGNPTGSFVIPSAGNSYFRPTDNPLRITASDKNDQFRDVVFNINGTNYEVDRASCDLREAGNYVLCDVDTASNWTGLSEGTYTATATLYNQASNHTQITSQSFTIDGTRPILSNFKITHTQSIYGSSVDVSADATDSSGIKNVTFYVTAPRASDGVCDGNGAQLASATGSLSSGSTYTATLDTSGLNGDYCLNAVAEDNATNHSLPVATIKATFDDIAPDAPTLVSPDDGAVVNGSSITQSWSDGSSDIDHYIYQSFNDAAATSLRYQTTYTSTSKTATNVAETTYWWRVAAVDKAGNQSGWSTLRKITVDNTAPVAPTATLTDNNDGDSVANGGATNSEYFTFHLNNPVSDGVTRYQLKYWNDISGSSFDGESNAWNPSDISGYSTSPAQLDAYVDHFTQGEGTHYFEFSACDAAGNCSAYSSPFVVTYDKTAPDTPSVANGNTAGTYSSAILVSLTSSDPSPGSGLAAIYYTTDNSTPSNTNGTLYSGAFSVSSSETVKAVAYDNAGNESGVMTETYTITPIVHTLFSSSVHTTAANTTGNTNPQGGGTTTTGNGGTGAAGGTGGGTVLGASTNTPNTNSSDSSKGNGSNSAVLGTTTHKAKNSSNFLGLGWWWLPILAILFGLLYGFTRSTNTTDKSA